MLGLNFFLVYDQGTVIDLGRRVIPTSRSSFGASLRRSWIYIIVSSSAKRGILVKMEVRCALRSLQISGALALLPKVEVITPLLLLSLDASERAVLADLIDTTRRKSRSRLD